MRGARKFELAVLATALAGAVLIPLQVTSAYASAIQVTTNEDELNSDGDCSLREAIEAANTNVAIDACVAGEAAPTVDVIGFGVTGTITLTAGELTVTDDLTMDGPGATDLTISGDDASRVLEVNGGVTLDLDGVSVVNGNGSDWPGGGGILNYGGILNVSGSVFSGNSAEYGGGISSLGTLTVSDSTFSENSAGWGGGGGILSHGYSANLTVTNSTFSGNSALGEGGGIFNAYGSATVTNSTFSENSAVYGGEIANAWGTTSLRNTIVAHGNSSGGCYGGVSDGGGNLDWPDTNCPGSDADPLLDTAGLQDNGGPTQTIALQAGSPAIDAAVACPPPTTDQRGIARPQGAGCDIGAYELEVGGWFQLEASVYGRWIHGQEWEGDLAQGDPVNVVVVDVDGTTELLDVTTTVADEGFRRSFEVDSGFDLQPSMTITATASGITKTLTLMPLTINSIDGETGLVTGTASPNIPADSILHVDTDISSDGSGDYISAWPGTDANGNWTVDFGRPLVPGNDTGADIPDEDGDATIFDMMVPEPAADVTAPVITVPAEFAANATSPSGAVVTYEASAVDLEEGPVPVTCDPPSGSTFHIGDTTIVCSASDSAGNSATAETSVHVKGAFEQLDGLMTAVSASSIRRSTKTVLLGTLQAARRSLVRGRTTPAYVALEVFVLEVRMYEALGRIPEPLASTWIESARRIEAVMGYA